MFTVSAGIITKLINQHHGTNDPFNGQVPVATFEVSTSASSRALTWLSVIFSYIATGAAVAMMMARLRVGMSVKYAGVEGQETEEEPKDVFNEPLEVCRIWLWDISDGSQFCLPSIGPWCRVIGRLVARRCPIQCFRNVFDSGHLPNSRR